MRISMYELSSEFWIACIQLVRPWILDKLNESIIVQAYVKLYTLGWDTSDEKIIFKAVPIDILELSYLLAFVDFSIINISIVHMKMLKFGPNLVQNKFMRERGFRPRAFFKLLGLEVAPTLAKYKPHTGWFSSNLIETFLWPSLARILMYFSHFFFLANLNSFGWILGYCYSLIP